MINIQNDSPWWRKLEIAGYLVIFNIVGQFQNIAQAQIVIDSTLGTEHSIVTPKINSNNLLINQINGGAIRGTNLFHSFLEFNVSDERGVYFNNPLNIKNIFTRVTGNNPSNILGTLGTNSTANLFLINPNGILFGKNARLDVQGSFMATTANSVQFGNQGFFSATHKNSPALLTVNPSAILFNQIANKSIINQSALQVPDGKSLLLLGGNIFLDGGKLEAPEGRIELAGLASPGTIGLTVDNHNLQINLPPATLLADIKLINNSLIDASGKQNLSNSASAPHTRNGNIELHGHDISLTNNSKIIADTFGSQDGGKINIAGSHLSLETGSVISASTFSSGRGGDINVTASQAITLTGFGGLGTLEKIQTETFQPTDIQDGLFALSFGTGAAGNLEITTPRLILRDGAATVASTFGSGQGGSLTINANQLVDASKSLIFAGTLGSGDAGNLTITTNKLLITDLAAVETTTHGKGQAGTLTVNASDTVEVVGSALNENYPSIVTGIYANSTPLSENIEIGNAGELTINTRRLIVRDGGEIGAGTFGKGQGGSLTINASDSLDVTGALPTPFNYPSSLFAISTGAGDAGKLTITTKRLSVRDGGTIATGTSSSGNGGSLVVNASDIVELAGGSPTSPKAIIQGFYYVGSRFPSMLITNSSGTGNAGDLTITTNKLIVHDLAQIEASTQAQGKAGALTVNAADSVEVIGSQLYPGNLDLVSGIFADSTPPRTENINAGDAGELTINTNRLIVRDGGEIGAGTSGRGKGGNITINARNSVEVTGATPDDFKLPSTIYTDTYGIGDAGDAGELRIITGRLIVGNGGMIAAGTSNSGIGGNLIVNASDSIELTGSSPATQAAIDAGFYYVGSRFPSSLITSSSGSGDAGNLTINTNKLIVSNQAQVALNGSGSGNAGNLDINAKFLQVQNTADVVATTTSGEGGNIRLQAQNLQLRDRGKISTTAGGSGNGGNLTLKTDTLVAIQNSELTANAYLGRGGKIEIISQGVFRAPDSKITASSQLGINGVVEIKNFGTDPSKGLSNLPVEVLNIPGLINQSCSSGGREVGSQLSLTGRGGLPTNPQETLNGQTVLADLATPSETRISTVVSPQISHPHPQPSLIEATGWQVNNQGQVILTAYADKVTPSAPWQKPLSCQS